MLTAEAAVETGRASRYLVQLCRHLQLATQAHPQLRAQVDWSDDHGLISLPWGRCTLDATAHVLTLRAEAPDADSLRELQTRIADRLAQVGRRDRLTVTWSPPRAAAGSTPARLPQTTREDPHMTDHPRHHEASDDTGMQYERESTGLPRWVKVAGIVIAVVVLLVVVVMLVSGGHGPRRHGLSAGLPDTSFAPVWTVVNGGIRPWNT